MKLRDGLVPDGCPVLAVIATELLLRTQLTFERRILSSSEDLMRVSTTLALLLFATTLVAQPALQPIELDANGQVALKNEIDSVSYAVGLNLGTQALKDSIDLNADALAAGLRDARDSASARLTSDQIQNVMMAFQQKLMMKQQ